MTWLDLRMQQLARELNYIWGWRSGFVFGFAVGALTGTLLTFALTP